jgi:hypothetical protein
MEVVLTISPSFYPLYPAERQIPEAQAETDEGPKFVFRGDNILILFVAMASDILKEVEDSNGWNCPKQRVVYRCMVRTWERGEKDCAHFLKLCASDREFKLIASGFFTRFFIESRNEKYWDYTLEGETGQRLAFLKAVRAEHDKCVVAHESYRVKRSVVSFGRNEFGLELVMAKDAVDTLLGDPC